MVYGDTHLDDYNAMSACVGTWPFNSCGNDPDYLLPLVISIYFIITNSLLINLLIAMVCTRVSE